MANVTPRAVLFERLRHNLPNLEGLGRIAIVFANL